MVSEKISFSKRKTRGVYVHVCVCVCTCVYMQGGRKCDLLLKHILSSNVGEMALATTALLGAAQ